MQVYYAPDLSSGLYTLDERESKHIVRVLRMTKGTRVKLIDGTGNLYEGLIENPDPKSCSVVIESVIREFEKRDYALQMAASPLKNQDRFEWMIEKAVEIGVEIITPVICRNTEKPFIKPERINNLIISAMKQSLKAYRPVLRDPVTLRDFVAENNSSTLMIAHCNSKIPRRSIHEVYRKGSDAVILIGPEGDFTEEEIDIAGKYGYRSVHLGKSRLRSETAAVAACHSVYFINQ